MSGVSFWLPLTFILSLQGKHKAWLQKPKTNNSFMLCTRFYKHSSSNWISGNVNTGKLELENWVFGLLNLMLPIWLVSFFLNTFPWLWNVIIHTTIFIEKLTKYSWDTHISPGSDLHPPHPHLSSKHKQPRCVCLRTHCLPDEGNLRVQLPCRDCNKVAIHKCKRGIGLAFIWTFMYPTRKQSITSRTWPIRCRNVEVRHVC